MKPPLRTKSVGTKVSEAEFALMEERARGAGMRLAEWVREVLLGTGRPSGVGSEAPDTASSALAGSGAQKSASQDMDRDAERAELLAALDAEVESETEREAS